MNLYAQKEYSKPGQPTFIRGLPWMINQGQTFPRDDWRQSKKGKMKPHISVELEWVHGYKAWTMKNNIGILRDGSIAYPCAAVGTVFENNESLEIRT